MRITAEGLRVTTLAPPGRTLVHDVSLVLAAGGRVGLVGRSGSGKSLLIQTLTGFLPPRTFARAGTVTFDGQGTVAVGTEEHRRLARQHLSVVWQDSIRALNPCQTVERQLVETLRLHGTPRHRATARTAEWLARVGFTDPRRVRRLYPHQMSGGMRQRVSLALGLCGGQPVVVADEPTTALDTVSQRECVRLLDELCREDSRSLLFVSHDLALSADLCDRLAVVDGGRIVEEADTRILLASPSHPRTRELLAATRRLRPGGAQS